MRVRAPDRPTHLDTARTILQSPVPEDRPSCSAEKNLGHPLGRVQGAHLPEVGPHGPRSQPRVRIDGKGVGSCSGSSADEGGYMTVAIHRNRSQWELYTILHRFPQIPLASSVPD